MNELILKGYARESVSAVEAGKCWYLPHPGVYHPNKPGKICVVFGLSAEFHGTSINKALLSRPDLTNQIAGVLLRFRKEQIAVTGDIEMKQSIIRWKCQKIRDAFDGSFVERKATLAKLLLIMK